MGSCPKRGHKIKSKKIKSLVLLEGQQVETVLSLGGKEFHSCGASTERPPFSMPPAFSQWWCTFEEPLRPISHLPNLLLTDQLYWVLTLEEQVCRATCCQCAEPHCARPHAAGVLTGRPQQPCTWLQHGQTH